jgi:hypothetical protein
MNVTKQTFNTLSIEDRLAIVWDMGLYLDSVNYYRYKAYLYALGSFFVEIFYHQDSAQIEKVEIASEDNLIKYLNRIDINTLHAW